MHPLEKELRVLATNILIDSRNEYGRGAAGFDFRSFRELEEGFGWFVPDDLKNIIERTYQIMYEKGVITLPSILYPPKNKALIAVPVFRG